MYAWFGVTNARKVDSGLGESQALTVNDPAARVEQIYIKFTYTYDQTELDLTTSDGYSYGYDAAENRLTSYDSSKKYGTATWTNARGTGYEWYSNAGCTALADSGLVSNIVGGQDLTITVSAGARTRITKTNPSSSTFATAFADSLNAEDVTLGKVRVVDGGTLDSTTTGYGLSTFYYSFAGQVLRASDVADKAWAEGREVGEDMTHTEVEAHPYLSAEVIGNITAADRTISFVVAVSPAWNV